MTVAQKKWIKMIHIAKYNLKLTQEQYEAILFGAIGSCTSKDVKTWEQYETIMNIFKKLGFVFKKTESLSPVDTEKRNPDHLSSRQEYYIKGLWKLASRKKDEGSLRAMIRRIGKVDDISFLSKKDATKVIQALRDITAKAGYAPDGRE
jgi:phage gp16-like protein